MKRAYFVKMGERSIEMSWERGGRGKNQILFAIEKHRSFDILSPYGNGDKLVFYVLNNNNIIIVIF